MEGILGVHDYKLLLVSMNVSGFEGGEWVELVKEGRLWKVCICFAVDFKYQSFP